MQEYPLMMQVRLFWKGNLWKGVLVVNLKVSIWSLQLFHCNVPIKCITLSPLESIRTELTMFYCL
jgi:hypothetical protein